MQYIKYSILNTVESYHGTGQSIYPLGKVPIEILLGKLHITWVSAVLLFTAEFQMEPRAPSVNSYYTRPSTF